MNFQYTLYQPVVGYITQPIYIQVPIQQVPMAYFPTMETQLQEMPSFPALTSSGLAGIPEAEDAPGPDPSTPERPGSPEGYRGRGPRQRILEKELESAKKNAESNIINQMLSFYN